MFVIVMTNSAHCDSDVIAVAGSFKTKKEADKHLKKIMAAAKKTAYDGDVDGWYGDIHEIVSTEDCVEDCIGYMKGDDE